MGKNEKQPPKYQTIKDYVTTRIASGEFGANNRIPSENEFAQMLGVSSITIRKALSELVNEGLIYRVKGKGSFVADAQRRPANGANDLVAFLITTVNIHDASIMQFIMGMQKRLSESGHSLIVENMMNFENNETSVIERLIENKVGGFIVYPDLPANSSSVKYLAGLNVPFVVLDRYPKGIPVNFVGCNNQDGAYSGTQHLISLGHKKIGFIAYAYNLSSERERYAGYAEAMESASMPIDDELVFTADPVQWSKIAELVRSGRLTALMCVNDMRALQVIDTLLSMGIRIPDDLSVMGFDDAEFAKHARVPISTVRQPFHDIGYAAANMLLDNIKNTQRQFSRVMLGTQLMVRESTKRLEK